MQFAHITPTPHLRDFAVARPFHLTLAHLTEIDSNYVDFYNTEKAYDPYTLIIQDNSAFEMYKQHKDMYPADKLLDMGEKIQADYLVMTDYPAEPGKTTIISAEILAPKFKEAGFGTFFCPQSRIGDLEDLIKGFMWAVTSPLVDYIGVSILAIPNAYGVEKNNKLQRYLSRYKFMQELDKYSLEKTDQRFEFHRINNKKKLHFLGMVDGPNEIELVNSLDITIDTWDSSAAVWAGLNGIQFDNSPTGLVNGKFEEEVNFSFYTPAETLKSAARFNIDYIDRLAAKHGQRRL